jgi:hypothetical protein
MMMMMMLMSFGHFDYKIVNTADELGKSWQRPEWRIE